MSSTSDRSLLEPVGAAQHLRDLLERNGYSVSRCHEEDGHLVCTVRRRPADGPGIVRVGDIWLDPKGRLAGVADRLVPLTELETSLFQVLLERCGRLVTIAELIAAVWPREARVAPRGRLHTLMFALRQKLEGKSPDLRIEASRNGYRLWSETLAGDLTPTYLPGPFP